MGKGWSTLRSLLTHREPRVEHPHGSFLLARAAISPFLYNKILSSCLMKILWENFLFSTSHKQKPKWVFQFSECPVVLEWKALKSFPVPNNGFCCITDRKLLFSGWILLLCPVLLLERLKGLQAFRGKRQKSGVSL